MTVAALLLAGGRGLRAGAGLPKQYRPIGGRPLLRLAVESFMASRHIDVVRVVIHPEDEELYFKATAGMDLLTPVHGGPERHLSALAGLESLEEFQPSRVLIHDAARPFIDRALIERVVQRLDEAQGVIPAVQVSDTLKRVVDGSDLITETVDRSELWRAQTPQGFHFASILDAHRQRDDLPYTDDAAVFEAAGFNVAVVPGEEGNFKVTTEPDFARAEQQRAGTGATRIGLGFDVHRFGPGEMIWLCGVEIPFTKGLIGHSDADVALHAVTDALLGAVGAGDIGQHFPPSDERWRGAPSHIFVEEAVRLIQKRGGLIENVDVTIIGEQPKVSPYRDQMRDRLAELLSISGQRVNVKATTTERLGFTGRGEGLAAQAVAGVRVP